MTAAVRVIGLGHPDRGDDAAGVAVIERLRAAASPRIELRHGAADGAGLLSQLAAVDCAIVVDCARGGGDPGAILRLTAPVGVPVMATSSHGNALADALALGAALDCLPPRLTIFAVVGRQFGIGAAMSPDVHAALPALAARVLAEAACTKRP